MNARPTWHDALDAQVSLAEWAVTDEGGRWLFENYRVGAKGLPEDTQKLLYRMIQAEPSKARIAEPIFVSAEMCQLVAVAAESFEPEPLLPQDLTTATGFLYFEDPFEVPDRFDAPTTIKAFSWAPILTSVDDLGNDDVLAWMQRRDYAARWGQHEADPSASGNELGIDGLSLTVYCTAATRAGIVPMHFTPWWFGMGFDGNEFDLDGAKTAAQWWWKILQTTLRLMQQRLAVGRRYRPARPQRRHRQRLELPDHDVVVVRLRREEQQNHEPPQSDANYSHRFIVNGHWRDQWYPSEAVHRQIWISPYVKGPEDAPLIIRPKRAFTWSR